MVLFHPNQFFMLSFSLVAPITPPVLDFGGTVKCLEDKILHDEAAAAQVVVLSTDMNICISSQMQFIKTMNTSILQRLR